MPRFDAHLTKLIDVAFDEAEDRITNGDYRVTKDGKLIRVPMGGKELVISGATVYDKRQLHRNHPTAISSSQASDAALKAVMDKCFELGSPVKQVNSIPWECVEVADQSTRSGTKKGKSKKVSKNDAQ